MTRRLGEESGMVAIGDEARGRVVDRFETTDLGTARTRERYEEAMAKL